MGIDSSGNGVESCVVGITTREVLTCEEDVCGVEGTGGPANATVGCPPFVALPAAATLPLEQSFLPEADQALIAAGSLNATTVNNVPFVRVTQSLALLTWR